MADDALIAEMVESCPTPFYVFDEREVARRIDELRTAMPDGTVICYAMKANSFILEAAARSADAVEVCSPGEYRTCQALGVPDGRLVISGINKDPDFMRELICSGAAIHRYTAESPLQFGLMESLAREANVRIPILMRLTSGSQFGMAASEVRRIVREHRDNPHVDFCGVQFFSGTQKHSVKQYSRELRQADSFIASLEEESGLAVREFEYGPGLPAEYCDVPEDEIRAKDAEFVSVLAEALAAMEFAGVKILEIGRGIAASCGTYATRVVDAKCNKGVNYAIVDGGKHQISYYGPSLALNPPACTVMPVRTEGERKTWAICGSLCTTNDILVKQVEVCDLRIGDVIVFPTAGAYCATEGVSLFLSRDLPAVYLAGGEGAPRLVRQRIETDYLNTPQS